MAHGELSASCCTPNGGWNFAHPCTLSPSGSRTQAATAPSCERMGLGRRNMSCSTLPPFSVFVSFDHFQLDLDETWGTLGSPA